MAPIRTNNIISVDWTTSSGLTPFYDSSTDDYAVTIEVNKQFNEINDQVRNEAKSEGLRKILEKHDKFSVENVNQLLRDTQIPVGASGVFVPIKPNANIKILVKINSSFVDNLQEIKIVKPQPYDTITIDTYRLSQKINKTVSMLRRFDSESKDFVGKLYNVKLDNEAERLENFPSTIRSLIEANEYPYKESSRKQITIGISGSGPQSSEYLPIYVEYQTDLGTQDLTKGFNNFRNSKDITSNVMYILKNINEIQNKFPSSDESTFVTFNSSSHNSNGWQEFCENYIYFPPVVITRGEGRRQSPDFGIRQKIVEGVKKAGDAIGPAKTEEKFYGQAVKEFDEETKKAVEEFTKTQADFVGTHVVDNLDVALKEFNNVENLYRGFLSKYGLTGIAQAALRCAKIELPFDEIRAFLSLARNTFEDIVQILRMPILSLDDLIPTVDVMFDILEGVIIAVAQAVFDALWTMIKQILISLLENCGDISKANLGGIPLDDFFTKGAFTDLLGNSSINGLVSGINNPPFLGPEAEKFISNLNTFVRADVRRNLISGGAQGISDALRIVSNNLTLNETLEALRGNPTNDTIQITMNIAESLANKADASESEKALLEILNTQEKVVDFYSVLANFLNQNEIYDAVEVLQESFPKLSGALCDVDDSSKKRALLLDRGLNDQEIEEQLNASRERSRRLIDQLNSFLSGDLDLNSVLPPPFDDGQQSGMFTLNHPSFTYMRDELFTSMMRGPENFFKNDITTFPYLLQIEGQKLVEVPRVIAQKALDSVDIGGTHYRLNPAFQQLRREIGSDNAFKPPFKEYTSLDTDLVTEEDEPTPEGRGRALRKMIEVAKKSDDDARQGVANTRIEKSSVPARIFLPGLNKEKYEKYIIDRGDTATIQPARRLLDVDKRATRILIDSDGIKAAISKFSFEATPETTSLISGVINSEKRIILKNNPLPLSRQSENYLKDVFTLSIDIDGPNPAVSGIMYQKRHELELGAKTLNVLDDRVNNEIGPSPDLGSAKEKRFSKFLANVMRDGENIYGTNLVQKDRNDDNFNLTTNSTRPNRTTRLIDEEFLLDQTEGEPKIRSLYEEIWRDLIAEFFNQVGTNNSVLEKSYDLLNLNPVPTPLCPDPSLMNFTEIKRQVDAVYDTLYKRGLEFNLPNVSGLGSDKDNSLQQSFIYGCVRSIIRLYVIESVLRGLVSYNKLFYENVDQVYVSYIGDRIISGVKKHGYFSIFQAEVIKSYRNRYQSGLISFNDALEGFIRKEINCIAEAFLRILNKKDSDVINSAKLLVDSIPEYDVWSLDSSGIPKHDRYDFQNPEKGFKDWRNGGFYFEKYIRIKIKSDMRTRFGPLFRNISDGVYTIRDFNKIMSEIRGSQPNVLSEIAQGNTTPITFTTFDENPSCAPGTFQHGVTIEYPQPPTENILYSQIFDYIRVGYRLVCNKRLREDSSGNMPIFSLFTRQYSTLRDNVDKNKSYYHPDVNSLILSIPIVSVEEDFDLSNIIYVASTQTKPRFDFGAFLNDELSGLKLAIQETDEWSFLFDYCFPKNLAVSLVFMHNDLYIGQFPGVDKVFNNTKIGLRSAFLANVNSGNYQFNSGIESRYYNNLFQGKSPDLNFGQLGAAFILGLLKTAAEQFSPAVNIGKKLQFFAKATQGLLASATAGFGVDSEDNPFVPKDSAEPPSEDLCQILTDNPGLGDKFLDLLRAEPFILGLLPVDFFLGAPGPPLTPLGYFYLAYEPLMNELFKDKETKDIERCGDFSNQPCPPVSDTDCD